MPTQHKGISAAEKYAELEARGVSERKLNPVNDPKSTKYPERTFYWGRWRTEEGIEHKREQSRQRRQEQRLDPRFVERTRKECQKWWEKKKNNPEYIERYRARKRDWDRLNT